MVTIPKDQKKVEKKPTESHMSHTLLMQPLFASFLYSKLFIFRITVVQKRQKDNSKRSTGW